MTAVPPVPTGQITLLAVRPVLRWNIMLELTEHDIVRHRLVKELVRAYEETDIRRKKTRKNR